MFISRGTAQLPETEILEDFCQYPAVTQILYILKLRGVLSNRRMRGHYVVNIDSGKIPASSHFGLLPFQHKFFLIFFRLQLPPEFFVKQLFQNGRVNRPLLDPEFLQIAALQGKFYLFQIYQEM